MNYSSFSENERLQAEVMATYLAMQGIKASACDVQKAMRKEQQVAALVGSGADFGRMMLDSESRLWDALDLERVVFTDERVGWNRRHGNFHYQEMKLGQSYVLEIKEGWLAMELLISEPRGVWFVGHCLRKQRRG